MSQQPALSTNPVPVWEISLPYYTPDDERQRIPEQHRNGCDWTCRAKLNHATKKQWNGREVVAWDKTPSLALMLVMNRVTHIMDGADFTVLEDFTQGELAGVLSEAETFSWQTQEANFHLPDSVNVKVLFFNPHESRMIWTHVQASRTAKMKTHICATYSDGILSELELDFWMSIKLAVPDALGETDMPFNIGFRYTPNEEGVLSAGPVDLGRFNYDRTKAPTFYTGIEERYATLTPDFGSYRVVPHVTESGATCTAGVTQYGVNFKHGGCRLWDGKSSFYNSWYA